MNYSPNDIHVFLVLADTQHFGRAAQQIGVTQPAVTKAIRRIEAEAGVSLFERGAGGARLTADGQLFLVAARDLARQQAALQRLSADLRARRAGFLRLGLANPDSSPAACAALAELVRQRPGLRLSLHIDTSDRLDEAVDAGELDLAVTPAYPGHDYRSTQLVIGEDQVRVAARADHPLVSLDRCRIQDLEPYGWVMPRRDTASRRLVTDLLARAGVSAPQVVIEAEYVSTAILNIVAATSLLVAMPVAILIPWTGRLQALKLPELDFRRSQVLLSRTGTPWSPMMTAFREALERQRPRPRGRPRRAAA